MYPTPLVPDWRAGCTNIENGWRAKSSSFEAGLNVKKTCHPFLSFESEASAFSKLSVMSGIAAIAAGGLLVPPAPLWLLGVGVGAGAASAKTAQQELSKARRDAELEHSRPSTSGLLSAQQS